jgi:hypothetical protein
MKIRTHERRCYGYGKNALVDAQEQTGRMKELQQEESQGGENKRKPKRENRLTEAAINMKVKTEWRGVP